MKATARILWALCLVALAASGAAAESFASWSAKAEKAEKRRDTVAALDSYTNALRLWKKADGKKAKARLLAARGALYASAGSLEAALRDLRDAVKFDDGTASIFYRKGRIEFDMGRDSDAISDFYKATRLNLNYREAYLYRGFSYERQGDMKFSREDYKTACKLGLKAACSESARAKASAALAAGKPDAFEAATRPQESPGIEVNKPKRKRRYKRGWQACLDGLNSCVDGGGAYGDCVMRTKTCESSSAQGCCPQDCVRRYNQLVDQGSKTAGEGGLSEGEAFRQVFGEKPSCAEP